MNPKLKTIVFNKFITLNNLQPNGDFRDNETGYVLQNATATYSENISTVLASALSGKIRTSISVIAGHKYYHSIFVSANSNLVQTLFYDGASSFSGKFHSGGEQYERLSTVFTSGITSAAGQIQHMRDGRASGWSNVLIKNIMWIDLTKDYCNNIINTGKEPTSDQMDEWFPNWFNGSIQTIVR